MLALARVLRMGARLLLCDEPTEGLSPLLVQQVGDILRDAKEHGVTVLLVEQNLPSPPPSPTGTTCWPRAGSSSRWTTTRCVPAASASCSRTSASERRPDG